MSHDFPITDWAHSREEERFYMVGSHKLFLYSVPDAYEKKEESRDGDR